MPDDARALPLALQLREVVYLLDSISNADVDQGDEQEPQRIRPLARQVLLKLGDLLMELMPVGIVPIMAAEGTTRVTEREAWLLRGKITSGAMSADKQVIGLSLMQRLYALLLEFQAPAVRVADHEENRKAAAAKLAQLAAEEEARFPPFSAASDGGEMSYA